MSLRYASTPADVSSKVALMRAMNPNLFSATLEALTGHLPFVLNLSQYAPPALLSDTAANSIALRSAARNTVRTRCAAMRLYRSWRTHARTLSVACDYRLADRSISA